MLQSLFHFVLATPFLFFLLGIFFSSLVAFFIYCRKTRKTLRQGVSTLADLLKGDINALDVSALAKVHALENGGHLAAGTTQQILTQQVATVIPNGAPAPSTLTAAQV